jgi:hypothetical protein
MGWRALSPKPFRLFTLRLTSWLSVRESTRVLCFYERHPSGGRMEEEMHGLSEGLLELGCLPGSASSDSSPLPASDWRAENALTRSGGETDGLCTRIGDSPAQPCPRKCHLHPALTSTHLWSGSASCFVILIFLYPSALLKTTRRRGDALGKVSVREPLFPACPVDWH